MSKHLLSLMIEELKTIRIQCKRENCTGGIAEFDTSVLDSSTQLRCPTCNASLRGGSDDPLLMLGKAIRQLSDKGNKAAIEFVIAE